MFVKNIFLMLFLVVIFSCNKTTDTNEILSANDSIETNKIMVKSTVAHLNEESKQEVESWKEYKKFQDIINQYQNISISDALFNAKDLANLAQQLKDSLQIEKFNSPSVRIRLNVLHNETLRLADMSSIKSISSEDVIHETKNILNAFSSLNLKINNIVSQENLNTDLGEFIEEMLESPDSLNSNRKATVNEPITE